MIYLTITRTNIAFRVQTLNQFLHQPKQTHIEVALRIVRYLKKQPNQGVLLSSKNSLNLIVYYCGSDEASCPISIRSVTGYLIKLEDSLIT